MTCGWTRCVSCACAKPQSVPAITFSRPTRFAKVTMRSATSRGCSTVGGVMRDDARYQDLAGTAASTFSHTCHSCSWRGFAASIE